jgi:hypothetical protein
MRLALHGAARYHPYVDFVFAAWQTTAPLCGDLSLENASTIHIAAIAPISQHQSATEPAWLKARELDGLSRCRALMPPNCGTATTS